MGDTIAGNEYILGGVAALGGTVLAGAVVGVVADRHWNSAPYGVAIAVVVATVVGVVELVWLVRRSE